MLTAVVTGLSCGNRGDESLVEWLHFGALADRRDDLPVAVWPWMGDTRTPPKKDGFRDLLMALDPDEFQSVLSEWIGETLELELTEDEMSCARTAQLELLPVFDVAYIWTGHSM